jgi:hypothetical protein
MSDFPTTPDALTNEWLSDSLGTKVASFEVERLGEGAGLLGLVTRLTLDYAGSGDSGGAAAPASIIAKFPTPSAENRAVAETFDMYKKEVRFYRDLSKVTPARAPHTIRAEMNEKNSDFVLLLEDLSACRMGDQTVGCSVEEAGWAIEEMVSLHKTWWGRTDSPDLDWMPVHDNPAQCAGISGGFEAGWSNFLEGFGDAIPAGKVETYAKIGPQTGQLLQKLCKGALTVVHGDFRLDNMFFDVDGDKRQVAMFDWQGICKSCGPHDLGYFISQSLRTQERRSHQDALVRGYWEQLCEAGVSDYSFDDCWNDYRVAVLYLFNYAVVIAGTLDLSNARGVKMARALSSRSAETVDEVGALDLLE